MIQKCDGVKILDLEEKLEATGSEYIVTAEKDNNYKLPLESVADIVIGSSKFKAAIKDVYESSTPTASVSLDKDKFLFSFGIPAGRTGDAGKDGKDGKDGKVVLAGDSFSGLRVPQTTDTDFYLIDIYGSQNTTPKSGTIYVRSSNGSQIYISGDGSIYVQKVSGGNTYSASLDPTVGLVFKKIGLLLKHTQTHNYYG